MLYMFYKFENIWRDCGQIGNTNNATGSALCAKMGKIMSVIYHNLENIPACDPLKYKMGNSIPVLLT